MRLVLAVDLGTGGPKTALVSDDGGLVACAQRGVQTFRIGDNGAEQDPEEVWDAVKSSIREVLSHVEARTGTLVGVICISQYSSIVPTDAAGKPTHNMLLWMDGRGAPYGTSLYRGKRAAVETWVNRHGALPLPSGADSLSHILFVKNERPDVYERTRFFLEPMDFLVLKLTGEATSNLGSAFMMMLGDNRHPQNPSWDSELLALADVSTDKLPAMMPCRGPVGRVRRDVAEELGIPAGMDVYASMNDTQAAALATGAFCIGRGGLNIGTTCQVLAHTDGKVTDFDSHLVSAPSPVQNKYVVLAENGIGGGALRHLVEGVLLTTGALADTRADAPYADLDAAVAAVPPGAEGVLYLPWPAGALFPEDEPAMRAGFINVSLATTREHLVRAVLEGVATNLCAMIEPVERLAGGVFERLAFSGGGALSTQWAQILADVAQRPVQKLEHPRFANNLAGAFLVFEHTGLRELESIVDFIRVEHTFEPRAAYRDLYAGVASFQRQAFERLRPLFAAMSRRARAQ